MALVDADVKLQELVDLTASVRHAEPTEFLLKNANWPQLSFNPVQVRLNFYQTAVSSDTVFINPIKTYCVVL